MEITDLRSVITNSIQEHKIPTAVGTHLPARPARKLNATTKDLATDRVFLLC